MYEVVGGDLDNFGEGSCSRSGANLDVSSHSGCAGKGSDFFPKMFSGKHTVLLMLNFHQ